MDYFLKMGAFSSWTTPREASEFGKYVNPHFFLTLDVAECSRSGRNSGSQNPRETVRAHQPLLYHLSCPLVV